MMFMPEPGYSKAKSLRRVSVGGFYPHNNVENVNKMKPKIIFKLTMKVPGTKLLVDFLFGTRDELKNFLNLNKLKPFEVRMVINGNEGKK